MKISFVTTVFNEEKTIEAFLESLAAQTKKPDEIVIVDGGSKDKTAEKIKKFKGLSPKPKVIITKGTTIAQGRNRAIKTAKGEIIAMSDAGCVIHPDWLERITKPFADEKIGLVAGFYRMTGKSVFQKCLACYLGILPEKLDPENFMPSARSVAFRKNVWERVGGFNEKLERAGEDTLFNYRAKRQGVGFLTVKDALVSWEVPSTWTEAFDKFYYYAKGDGQAGIWWHPSQRISTHSFKISAIYARYLLGLVFLILGLFFPPLWVALAVLIALYLFWSIVKNYNNVKVWQATFILPAIQIVSDFAVMAGFLVGSMNHINES